MHTNDNVYLVNNTFSESASSSSTITPSQQRRHSTLRSLATRTLGRSSTLRRMSFLASDDVQTTTTIKPPVQETIPLISLFTPPPAPSVSIKQLDTTVKASSKMNRASLSIRRKRTSSRPTAMSIIGNNSNSTSNNNNNNSNTTNNSVNTSSNPSNSSNSGNITVNSSTIISTATITTIDINDSSINTLSGLVTSSGTSRTLPNITTTHTTSTNYDDDDPGFSPPNSPGAESILSAHDIDDVDPNATMNVTLPSDMSDRITATSTANTLLVSSPSTTSILSGYGHFTLSSPSSSSPMDGASPLSDGTTTIGRKTTLVGSIRRRLGARSRPSARSLRRAFVSGQTN
ncbi:hypothetical protein BDF22DRAFT_703876 [Syncephalis plumigaleata]|nr:hypothetical protein BDF22DRAFT_703876 [Syncephalis plumigaleata]